MNLERRAITWKGTIGDGAGQHTALDEELLRGCAWTVKFITSLLVGQHAPMQELCTRQASMMAAVNILQELEHLLQA